MPNLLNLRRQPESIIIEKVIRAPKIWCHEVLKMVAVVAIVSIVVYGVSRADTMTNAGGTGKNFSAIGIVSTVSPNELTLADVHSSDKTDNTLYTFAVNSSIKVETKSYVPFSFSDIKVGDQIIVQGLQKDGEIALRRIISLTSVATTSDLVVDTATSTATTTDATATTTDSMATISLDMSTPSDITVVGSATSTIATTTATTTVETVPTTDSLNSSTTDAIVPTTEVISVPRSAATSTNFESVPDSPSTTETIVAPPASEVVPTETVSPDIAPNAP
ncbi:MAG: hypothetical protein PHG25_04055 [Candidatus Pacebacteria bacterium]|nr:hypothetical protein [Candidatus Paceibacterota bacterium]